MNQVRLLNPIVRPGRMAAVQADARVSVGNAVGDAAQWRQLQEAGHALSQLGQAVDKVQAEQLQKANQVRVLQAQNRARRIAQDLTFATGEGGGVRGFSLVKGEAALQGENGMDLTGSYVSRLNEALDAEAHALSNDAQRQAFAVWRDQLVTDFAERVQRHQAGEFEQVQQSAFQGALDLQTQQAAADWQSPERVRDAIEGLAVPGDDTQRYGGVRHAAHELARAKGLSASQTEVFTRNAVSRAHMGVLAQAVGQGATAWAQEYIERHKNDILAGDLLKVQEQIQGDLRQRENDQIVHEVFQQSASDFAPTPFDNVVSVVRQIESGGRDLGKDGKPLTSWAGAKYAMQVMPATAKKPGYGIRPAQSDTPEEYNRVGRELLAALLQKYGGNAAMALSAYNGGAKHTDQAVAAARQAGRPQDWPEYLRQFKGEAAFKENYAYIRKGMALLSGEGGARVESGPPPLEAMLQQAFQKLRPDAPASQRAALQQDVTRQHKALVSQYEARREQAFSDAADALWQSKGNMGSISPALMSRVPPEKRPQLLNMAKAFASEEEPKTDYGLYYDLVSQPGKLADANLIVFKPRLAEAEFKELMRMQTSLRKERDQGKEQTLTAVQGIGSVVDNMARQIKVDKDPEKMGLVYADVQRRVTQAEQLKGGRLTPQEQRQLVAQTFEKLTVDGFLWNSDKPAFAVREGDRLVVPKAERAEIEAALKRSGRPVTEDNVQALYRRSKGL